MARVSRLLRNLFRRERVEEELDEELRTYLELLAAEKVRGGMSPDEAHREARMELGGMDSVKEQVREARAGARIDSLVQDVRQALRGMRKHPGTTALALLMLALGTGATTAIFSVFYSVLLQPLPFGDPERIVQIWETRARKGWQQVTFTEANFWDIRTHNRTFEEVAAYHSADANLTGFGPPEHISLGQVSAGFFRVLGITPVLGRDFLYSEDRAGAQPEVLVLRHRFWKQRFGGDPEIVGKTVRLNGRPVLVVGVLPPGDFWLDAADAFVPLVYRTNADRGSFEYSVIGRLREGISIAAAQADLQTICARLAAEYPKDDAGMGVSLVPAAAWMASAELRRALWVLLAAVGFLVAIACVNLANLLLARATGRIREIAIRAALGASRGRIARLVLTEAVILGLAGAGLGLLLAYGGLRAIQAAAVTGIPRLSEASLNGWVLAFTLAIALLTGILAGLAPALQMPSGATLREGGRTQAGSRLHTRLRGALVAGEVALCLVLLIGAGLLIRSFSRLLSVERGFQSNGRLMFAVNVPGSYSAERVAEILDRFLRNLRRDARVLAVAAVSSRPILGGNTGMGIGTPREPDSTGGNVPWATWRLITPEYFRAAGVPLLRGRTFNARGEIARPWRVVVSQSVAELLYPGQDPIGRQMILWKGQSNLAAEIIGVVGNMRERGLEVGPTLAVYMPYRGTQWSPIHIVVHAATAPMTVVPSLRPALAEADATLPISDVQTMEEVVSRSVAPRRLQTLLVATFGGLALLLATTGIYGVLAYSIGARTAEIGVRVALGAGRGSIVRLALSHGMRPVVVGIVAGVAGALAVSRLLASLLFGVMAADPISYTAAAALLAASALAACYIPARRALRVDPAAALRAE